MLFYDNPPLQTYLAHHGIKGQKWGVRRFQNPDGTLTEEGKKRYVKDTESSSRKKSYQELSTEERFAKAKQLGITALEKYAEIDAAYEPKFQETLKRFDHGDDAAGEDIDRLEKEQMKDLEKILRPLYKAGYDFVHRFSGSDGYKAIQFGKYLDIPEKSTDGEKWVDQYMAVIPRGHKTMNVYLMDDW